MIFLSHLLNSIDWESLYDSRTRMNCSELTKPSIVRAQFSAPLAKTYVCYLFTAPFKTTMRYWYLQMNISDPAEHFIYIVAASCVYGRIDLSYVIELQNYVCFPLRLPPTRACKPHNTLGRE